MKSFIRWTGSRSRTWWLFLGIALCLTRGPSISAEDKPAEVKVLYTFSRSQNDGSNPQGTLLAGSDGALYGMTTAGGADRQGTVFKLSKDGTGYQVLHSFQATGNDGRGPLAGVIEAQDGWLYGVTEGGGASGAGTIFKIGKDGSGYRVVHTFAEWGGIRDDGRKPYGPLTQSKGGALFGTTTMGGAYTYGTVFRLNTNGTDYRILHHFGRGLAGDAKNPHGALLQASDGDLYGTTTAGPQLQGGAGTVFAISEEGGQYRLIHAFPNGPHDGARPYAGLIEGSDGKLYGTTVAGGQGSRGVVFRLNKDGTVYEILRAFSGFGADGWNPYGAVVEGKDGALYGTTLGGGPDGGGLVFRLSRDGRDYRTLFAFTQRGLEGRGPYAGLILAGDDAFYGATCAGTGDSLGTVFCLKLPPKP